MSKTDIFENDLLKLIFNATLITGLARDAASPVASLWVSLHTASPGEGGDQTTNEVAYTSYARVAALRDVSGWIVTGNSVSPDSDIVFPTGTGGSGIVTHWGVGTASTGAGKLLYFGTVAPNIVTGNLLVPRLTTASTITEN